MQHFDSRCNRDPCAAKGLCIAFEAQKGTLLDIYFTLLDAASITLDFAVNSHAQGEQTGQELGSLSKSEQKKLLTLYKQGFAAYGFVRNLAKAAKLSPSKIREFLQSKTSYNRFTQATHKFEIMRAFARFKDEIWWMDLAYVDKLANDKNGLKHLLVRQDLLDRTVDEKGMKTKIRRKQSIHFQK